MPKFTDERVTLGKNYKYSGYSSVSEQLVAANLQGITPPPETGDLNNIEFMASTTDEDQSAGKSMICSYSTHGCY